MDLKFPDSIWWPKLTVTWFCIMDESSVSPGDVAKRRRTSSISDSWWPHVQELIDLEGPPWDFWVLQKGQWRAFQWEHLFLFSPNSHSVPFLFFQVLLFKFSHQCHPQPPWLECLSISQCTSVSLIIVFSLSMSFHTGAEALDSVLSFIFSLIFKSRFWILVVYSDQFIKLKGLVLRTFWKPIKNL